MNPDLQDITMRPPSPPTLSKTRNFQAYFTPLEVAYLSEKQRGKLSESQEEKARLQACSFIDAVGTQMGFPRKTIATTQALYHRFHLFFPLKDFNYCDVAMACLYVSTKMHDTLKKPREILMVSYAVRFPELAAKVKVIGGEVEMQPNVVEADRRKIIAIERLILETVCFNFMVQLPFSYVIKASREFGATKELGRLAWRLAVDSYRTLIPLQYPPHTIALASLYLAALLSSFEVPASPVVGNNRYRTPHQIVVILGENGAWEDKFKARVEDLEDICHALLDLLIVTSSNTSGVHSVTTSPTTPSSPSPHPSPHFSSYPSVTPAPNPPHPSNLASVITGSAQLTRLKILLREREHEPRERVPISRTDPSLGINAASAVGGWGAVGHDNVEGLGKNEGTVRFLFGPAQ